MRPLHLACMTLFVLAGFTPAASPGESVPVDLSRYHQGSGVTISHHDALLRLTWPMAQGEYGVLVLQLRRSEPMIEELGVAGSADDATTPRARASVVIVASTFSAPRSLNDPVICCVSSLR